MKTFIYILITLLTLSCKPPQKLTEDVKDVENDSTRLVVVTSNTVSNLGSDDTLTFNPKLIEIGSYDPNDRVEGIGLGNTTTIGHGSGQGFGSGSGRLGGRHPASTMGESPMGHLTYYIPDTMKVGKSYKIQLRISKHNTVEFHMNMDSNSVKKVIRIGSLMEAKLTDVDDAFKVNTTNTSTQSIERDSSYTEWVWYVTPLKGGKHLLKLTIVIKEDNLTKDIPVYEDRIYVQSSPIFTTKEFIRTYWQYMLGVIGTCFAWWYSNMRKKKKSMKRG